MTVIMDEFVEMMRQACGLDLSHFDPSFLAKSLEKGQMAAACPSARAYLQRLAQDRLEAEIFYRSLLVNYSEFFRSPLTFALLEQLVLPGLADAMKKSSRNELRIWSAGCAGGQEAYSVAILLEELAKSRDYPIPYRIFASDLSEPDLALARAGVFNAAAVRNIRHGHLEDYFTGQGETYTLAPRIREQVEFSFYDLLDPKTSCPPASIYGEFDLVLCCNVLLYYGPEAQCFILNKMRQSMTAHGYFITGEAERLIATRAGGWRGVALPAAVFSTIKAGDPT